MPILKNIPITLDPQKVIKELHLDRKPGSKVDVNELISTTESLIEPRVSFKVSYIAEKNEDSVNIDGADFTSSVLRINLEEVERVFPYIITIGKTLEDTARSYGDLLRQYYLENIGDMVLSLCKKYLEKHIKRNYGLTKISSMSPGSLKNWPVTEQKPLFSLFPDIKDLMGVNLTDHMLMIPRKSISGIIFPKEKTFISCQLCSRDRCPSRIAPFDEKVKEKYGVTDD